MATKYSIYTSTKLVYVVASMCYSCRTKFTSKYFKVLIVADAVHGRNDGTVWTVPVLVPQLFKSKTLKVENSIGYYFKVVHVL